VANDFRTAPLNSLAGHEPSAVELILNGLALDKPLKSTAGRPPKG
jgi:hypothetical protein